MSKARDRRRVTLKPFEDNPRETGVVEGVEDDVILVRVDEEYRDGDDDDGLREVTADQLE